MAANQEIRKETTIRDFLNVVFRRKALILAIVLLATAVVIYLNTRQATVYESDSRILVKRGERDDVFSGRVRYLTWEEEVSSQIEVILSQSVFQRARRILADSAAVWGRNYAPLFNGGNVRADVIGESNVFVIRYTDPDPVMAQRACAAVTQAYGEYYRRRTAPPAISDFLAMQIEDIKGQLDHWLEKKREFMNRYVYLGMGEEGRFLLSKIGLLEAKLQDVEGEISKKRVNVENLKALLNLKPSEVESRLSFSTSNQYMQSGIISNIKYSIHNARLKREDLLSKYTSKHPEVVAADSEIADLQRLLKKEVVNYYNLESSQFAELLEKRVKLKKELEEVRKKLDEIPDKEMEMQKIESRISILRDKYELLLKKQDEAEIALASSPEWEVTVLSGASPAYPKKTKDYIRIALGPFFSFIIALGLAFFFESLDHSFKNVAEVEEYLEIPVLGTVSELKIK